VVNIFGTVLQGYVPPLLGQWHNCLFVKRGEWFGEGCETLQLVIDLPSFASQLQDGSRFRIHFC
jgi:hypothetical protein